MATPRRVPQPCHILIVESSPELRRFMALLLEGEHHKVTTQTTAEEARALLRPTSVDVIITDSFGRGREDAVESVRGLLQAARRTPVVLCTGYQLSPDEWRRAGVRDLILKPFDPDVFLTRVGQWGAA